MALANEMEEYKIIQSIPGIGEKIAATIISEIGEIDRFNHPKNWWPSLEWIQVFTHRVSLRQPLIVLPKGVRADYVILCILPYYAA